MLIVFHAVNNEKALPGYICRALAGSTLGPLLYQGLLDFWGCGTGIHEEDQRIWIPQAWSLPPSLVEKGGIGYGDIWPFLKHQRVDSAMVINGQFPTWINASHVEKIKKDIDAEILCVTVDPELNAPSERISRGSDGTVMGFYRSYTDAIKVVPAGKDWPHRMYLSPKVIINDGIPDDYQAFVRKCQERQWTVREVRVAGCVLDLETESGMLSFLGNRCHQNGGGDKQAPGWQGISSGARLCGSVYLGHDVCVAEDAVVAGASILSDRVEIGRGAIVKDSIIGEGIKIPENSYVAHRIIFSPGDLHQEGKKAPSLVMDIGSGDQDLFAFRHWPSFSYSACYKRWADIGAAFFVLLLFSPVFIIIGMATKINSPGPIFFAHKRQGRYGREFKCFKFRTMIPDSDQMQNRLRRLNQVDGPQFMMEDDPRVTKIGKFMRDTCLDEIPQFYNVLMGHMSLVGPRPSPEAENSLCPPWRDARLSVRPGITGLWQICRTRSEGQDFQEWVYYDMKYVRELSWRLDVWICWRTVKKLFREFFRKF